MGEAEYPNKLVSKFSNHIKLFSMKKYLAGFAAVVISVIALSFTTAPKMTMNKITGKVAFDVCNESDKRFFQITLSCTQQQTAGALDVAKLRNAANYTLFGTGTVPPTTQNCPGSICVCVIKACPDAVDPTKPDISTATDIYSQLGTYVSLGGNPTGLQIVEKQQ